ncbi:hypothetical protein Pcinc_001715 [Petrolisthes cinctipes]|uniref:Lipocalin/cytosolic fatty-acid binding domain-containing protein n=1 Tax=Petrolisthes cinctipes TaxID=88211 RepID=A0AAE1GMU6_PETCI|nr:hypothetical protein Pcinc_001715 [Petrolisthes cinctipes]
MNCIQFLLPVLVLVGYVGAQVLLSGPCPKIPPMKNFDPKRFLGRWYELERYFVSYEGLAGTCWVENYLYNPNRGHYTRLDWTDHITRKTLHIENGLTFNKYEPGRLHYFVERPFLPFLQGEYLILATDYSTFALAWQCMDLPLKHTEILWLLSKQQYPEAYVVKKAKSIASGLGLDVYLLRKQDRAGCPN